MFFVFKTQNNTFISELIKLFELHSFSKKIFTKINISFIKSYFRPNRGRQRNVIFAIHRLETISPFSFDVSNKVVSNKKKVFFVKSRDICQPTTSASIPTSEPEQMGGWSSRRGQLPIPKRLLNFSMSGDVEF